MVTYSIGVDIGGTKILAGLVDEEGSVTATARRTTPRNDAAGVLEVVGEVVQELAASQPGQVIGVGLGVAGPVDGARATVFFAPNLGWAQVPVRNILESMINLPVIVENDGNAAAWGEFRFGAGVDIDELTMVTVGTGIGGGIIIGGELLRGAHGAAGEIGHMNVVVNGRPCGCGRGGCWEQYASGNALVREARSLAADRRSEAHLLLSLGDGTPEGVQGLHVTQAAQAGDPVALEAFVVVGTWLGRGLADLCAILDPGTFVVGGGVCEAGELLLASTRYTLLDKLSGQEQRPAPGLRLATLGNNAGLIGAADLARNAR
jgi:glucokinase